MDADPDPRRGWFAKFEQSLCPDFNEDNNGPELRRLFTQHFRIGLLFAVIVIIWSVAAGSLEAGQGVMTELRAPASFFAHWDRGLIVLFGVLWAAASVLKLLGVIALLILAAWLLGGFVGFLFGVPSRSGQSAQTGPGLRWEPSTNLVQIADWLTKVIVGISLVESKSAFTDFFAMSHRISQNLLHGEFGSGVVVPAVMIGATVLGFIGHNLFTLLFVARLIAQAGNALEQSLALLATSLLTSVPIEISERARSMDITPAATEPPPSPAMLRAAVDVTRLHLDDISDSVIVLAWSRASLILGEDQKAAEGYRKLLSLKGTERDARTLYEAAGAFFKVGAQPEATATSAEAVRALAPGTPLDLRVKVLRDYALLALHDKKNHGYADVISTVSDADVIADKSGSLALFRACAYGQKVSDELPEHQPPDKYEELRESTLADLKTALAYGQKVRWIRHLADPNAPGKPPEKENDLQPFFGDQAFQDLLSGPDSSGAAT